MRRQTLRSISWRASQACAAAWIFGALVACGDDESPKRRRPPAYVEPTQDMGQVAEPDMSAGCEADSACKPGERCAQGVCVAGACEPAQQNACGGCEALSAQPGAPCGACQRDVWVCAQDLNSVTCSGDTACEAAQLAAVEISNVTQRSATLTSELTTLGQGSISEHGFCVSQQPLPSVDQSQSVCTKLGPLSAPGLFAQDVQMLSPSSTYYVRAYAAEASGAVAYSEQAELMTEAELAGSVRTTKIESPASGEITVLGEVDMLGEPVAQGYGVCLGLKEQPALGDGESNCQDLGAPQLGALAVEFKGLAPGLTYYARAFIRSESGAEYGQQLSKLLAPGQPIFSEVSKGSFDAHVRLSWAPVIGATGYKLMRDGVPVTAQPITGMSYDDAQAQAGPAPSAQGLGLVASSDLADHVRLSWSAPVVAAGVSHQYALIAINAGGDSAPSATQDGYRAASPITGYELSAGGGAWRGVSGLSFDDTSAPAGTISQASATASQGTSSAAVFLSLQGADAQPGAAVNYKVRAVSAAGVGDESAPVQGNRALSAPNVQWQRSSGASDAGYSDIAGATGRTFMDTGAPSDGSTRYYRAVISAAGASMTTPAVSGYRSVGLPTLTTLAPTSIGLDSAKLGGRVDAMGTGTIVEHGYCVGTSAGATYTPGAANPSCRTLGSRAQTGAMTEVTFTGLNAGQAYFVRTFAQVTRNGSPFVAYGADVSFVTKPKRPTLSGASSDKVDYVELSWSKVAYATSYKLLRDGVVIATIPAAAQLFFVYRDIAASSPQRPDRVTGLSRQQFCDGSRVFWQAPAASGPGSAHVYTLVTVNAAGESEASVGVSGRRAAAPLLGFKIKNLTTGNVVTAPASAREQGIHDNSYASFFAGTASATKGVARHSTYVELVSSGTSKMVPPTDTVTVVAYNSAGESFSSSVLTSRATCDLVVQWQRSDASTGPFVDLPGAVGTPWQDTSAPAGGQSRYYRAKVFVAGADAHPSYTAVQEGYRYSLAPAVETLYLGQITKTSMRVGFEVVNYGVPAMGPSQFGLCLSTSPDPAPGKAGADCMTMFRSGCSKDAGETWWCNVTNLMSDTRYYAKAYGINAKSAPSYVFGRAVDARTLR